MVVFQIDKDLKGLELIQDRLQNLQPLLQKIAIYFERETRATLERGQGRATAWPDLAEKTKKQKIRAKGTAYPILTFTGRLRNSINSEVENNAAHVFSGVQYGVFHQTGTKKMPARPFIEVVDKDLEFTLNELINHLFTS